jgi:hypothetical protein
MRPNFREPLQMSMRTKKTERLTAKSKATGLTTKQKRELAALAAMPDNQIDTADIPELPLDAWKNAVRSRFYRLTPRHKSFQTPLAKPPNPPATKKPGSG